MGIRGQSAAEKSEKRVALAIDKDKGSQYAIKWVVDQFLTRGQALTLLHVTRTTNSAPNHSMLIFCFFNFHLIYMHCMMMLMFISSLACSWGYGFDLWRDKWLSYRRDISSIPGFLFEKECESCFLIVVGTGHSHFQIVNLCSSLQNWRMTG